MNYHEQIINRHDCDCRPLLPADEADAEIQRLHSLIDSLRWANAMKDELITEAAVEIAELRRQLGMV